MGPRTLRSLDASPGSSAAWTTALARALDGGPALVPLPPGPTGVRDGLVTAFRPDDSTAALEHDDAVLVVPTSGSTGEPKGAVLTGSAVRASAEATFARLSGPGRWVLALPLTHVAGLMVVARSVVAGCAAIEVAAGARAGFDPVRFAAATDRAVEAGRSDGRPLYVSLVPTQLARLLDAAVDLRAFDAVLVGAAAAPFGLLDRARESGVAVVTTYGMTETCGGCVYDGVPLDGVTTSLDAAGRIVVGGPTVFAGYRLRPDLTRAALDGQGRFTTSDLGELQDGRLRVLGRADDVIVSGGENVAPARVEAVVASVPGVDEVVVVGVPDDEWGERVVAVVVGQPGAVAPTLAAVRAAAANRLPPAWVPRAVVTASRIPLLATGKVDRRAARELAAGPSAQPGPA